MSVIPRCARKVTYLGRSDILRLGGDDPALYSDAVESALALHARGEFVQPLKPYLRWHGESGHVADRIIAMPAYLGGRNPVAGIKWIGSRAENPDVHSIPRASALIVLNDVSTNYPIAVMEGALISAMRTAAVTAVGAKYLARDGFETACIIGCGVIGYAHLLTLLALFSSLRTVRLHDKELSKAQSLMDQFADRHPAVRFEVECTARAAVTGADVIIPCTTTSVPYISDGWLGSGTFVSNVSIMDVDKSVFLSADKVVVDDWDQSNRERKIINLLVTEGLFSREQLHAELGEIVIGKRPGRESVHETIVLNPMGMAIEDIACAREIHRRAVQQNVGTVLDLD